MWVARSIKVSTCSLRYFWTCNQETKDIFTTSGPEIDLTHVLTIYLMTANRKGCGKNWLSSNLRFLPWHLPRGPKENHKQSQLGQPTSGLRCEPETFWIQVLLLYGAQRISKMLTKPITGTYHKPEEFIHYTLIYVRSRKSSFPFDFPIIILYAIFLFSTVVGGAYAAYPRG
jgi:hypothetical protein